ncbi:MAG: hypothetical protein KDC99_07735, partial [Cyclobacteriaceae bacterium]|nr:hypothetical protein [Cyclobacteriaceae bacterium]
MEAQLVAVIQTKFKDWLPRQNNFLFTIIVALSSFLLYSCVYTFRKTFSVATFEGMAYLNISYKV